MGNMRFKVGDRVRIKSLDWYNENKDNNREIKFENGIFTTLKSTFLGQIMTIEEITLEKQYILMEDRYKTLWTDEMIEGLVEDETYDFLKTNQHCASPEDRLDNIQFVVYKELKLPEGYIFKDENGNVINATKIVLEKKKEYPKTYEECCEIMNVIMETEIVADAYSERFDNYEFNLDIKIETLRKLLICRDAYWQIAGEEMGLGKPWEPDYDNGVDKFGFICLNGVVLESNPTTNWVRHINKILNFPTRKMRDAFYENFKKEIENCKELL